MGTVGLLAIFLICILIHVPMAFSILVSNLLLSVSGGYSITSNVSGVFTGCDSFTLLAIPFFMLAGNIMCEGGIANRIIDFCDGLVGHHTGGFGLITILACFFFAAIAGSAVATIAAIGALMIPMMIRRGYSREYSSALAACASTMGPIVPPSVLFIPFCVMAGKSVSTLFAGGLIPGALMGICMAVANFLICKKEGYVGTDRKKSRKELLHILKDSWLSLLMPLIILYCIYGGVCTPTEVAVIACIYSLILGLFVYKEITIKDVFKILTDTASSAASVLIIVGPALMFGRLLAMERLPQALTVWTNSVITSPIVFLIFIKLFLLVVGMFMETTSAILILTPLFVPLATSYGINTYHFGMIMIINLAIGLCTPPMGLCAFTGAKIGGVSFASIFTYLVPLILSLLVALTLVTFIPQLTYFLPSLLGMNLGV